MPEQTIRAVAFREGDWWIAQCLEVDFVSTAATLEELPDQLLRQLRTQIEISQEAGVEPFAGFPEAPARFWRMYELAEEARKRAPQTEESGLTGRLLESLRGLRVRATLVPALQA